MKQHRASMTSEMVAAVRAMHHAMHEHPVIDDPYAHKLVGPMWWLPIRSKTAFRLMCRAGFHFDWAIAHCMARSRIAEDRLDLVRSTGPAQWVLLGAGLDMFAWRRRDLRDVPQFEVDHPATQRSKRRRIERLGLLAPPAHRFVPVDFERDRASEKLRDAGLSATAPTVFAWLGVTYYLTRDAIEASLRDIRSVASPGSFLVFDYRMPDRYLLPHERGPVFRSDKAFESWGEPMLSRVEPDDMHALLKATGWHLEHEHTAAQMAARYFGGGHDGLTPTSVYRVIEATPA